MQIALLIFCFLTITGAFTAWRRSPLYSLKTTFKLIGAFLLIVAIVVATTYAFVNGAQIGSPFKSPVAISTPR